MLELLAEASLKPKVFVFVGFKLCDISVVLQKFVGCYQKEMISSHYLVVIMSAFLHGLSMQIR